MDPTVDLSRLRFRRQFLLTRARVDPLSDWQYVPIGPFHLHCHPDLEVQRLSDGAKTVAIVGYVYDPVNVEKRNSEVVSDIFASAQTFLDLRRTLKRYVGQYVAIFHDSASFRVFNDPLGLREVYYCTESNLVLCGSQPNLLAEFSHPPIQQTTDPDILDFFHTKYRDRKWIGDDTLFSGVRHLLPNHYLDLHTQDAARYWPNEPFKPISLAEAVDKSCAFLQGAILAATRRHSVMMAVTAGTDSRTMLAVSRPVADKIYYFINDHGLGARHPDINIPTQIFASIAKPFHIHSVPDHVDDAFRQIFLHNVVQATDRLLPTIYNVYFKDHQHQVNMLGIGEIGRTRYGKEPRRLTPYRLAYALSYRDSPYVIKQCRRLCPELSEVSRKSGVNAMTLLYWEQMLGNWGTVGNSESDIAIEEFNPFDSHLLYETFLGVDPKYTKYGHSILFEEIIRHSWPALLAWPINPPHSRSDRVKYCFKRMGLHGLLKELKYQARYLAYRCSSPRP